MPPPRVYLDFAATTPVQREVLAAMLPFLSEDPESDFGNPSSRHPAGVRAAEALDGARRAIARALAARPEGVVFTSGGSESNNLAVFGLARAAGRGHVLVGAAEHPSVRAPAAALVREGFEVETLRLTAGGALDLEHAAARVRPDTVLVAQMLVHNELGSLYPVARLARAVRARSARARVHVDAVQALGKVDCALDELGCDSLSISAHKLGGPKGAGALVLAEGVTLEPLFHGGGQERGLRPGTQNVAGAIGLATAVERAERGRAPWCARAAVLRERLLAGLADLPGATCLLPPDSPAVASIVALRLAGAPAEVRMHHLERHGVLTSAGSACQSNKREASPSYAALGLDADAAREVLRISFGPDTSETDVDRALEALHQVELELGGLAGGKRARR
jgi:cysteine desulfurase